jgi:hypothetical protein
LYSHLTFLKTFKKNIYKIGKTADPHARFKSLCVSKVLPIALVNKDVEDILHAKYADNRIVNEDYKLNGATEWFRPEKFDEFIASVDKGVFLTSPCILWCKTFLKTKH